MSKATIGDVAKAAGVSKKTVSRVFNDESGVKQATKDKVLQKIAELGYMPNLNARRLRTNQSYLIGVLYVDYPGNFYSNLITSGAIEACDELGYDLLIRPFSLDNKHKDSIIRHMIDRSNIDGFIVIPPLCDDQEVLASLAATNVPIVRIAPLEHEEENCIHSDEIGATKQAINHLLSLGHTRIGFINYLVGHAAGAWRYEGYKQALAEAGIREEQELIQQHVYAENILEQACRRMLSQPNPPTAIFTVNDAAAAVLYRVATQLHKRIPYDLSVVGFDDDPLAVNLWPPLTTVRQPVQALGKAAANLLIKQLIQGKPNEIKPELLCQLVIRNSCGPVVF